MRNFVLTATILVIALQIASGSTSIVMAEPLPVISDVEFQPLAAQAKRVAQALELVGSPLSKEQQTALEQAIGQKDPQAAVRQIQSVLDQMCLAGVDINPESRVKVARGPAAAQLVQHGWRTFLVKVHNEAGVTAELRVNSPQAAPDFKRSTGSPEPASAISPAEVSDRWLDIVSVNRQPLQKTLSGLSLEYRLVELCSRDAGKREAQLAFDVGQGTQDLGFRNELSILFQCEPAIKVALEVHDDDGLPTTACFTFRDSQGRICPAIDRRLAPDFFFQQQVYRTDGETILLSPGEYQVTFGRGPEYLEQTRTIKLPPNATEAKESFRLKRWIKLADHGWFSGDHHVHAAGCAHYESPTQGVGPADMLRQIKGEDLNVGCVLSWGPCWYFQKQFFTGKVDPSSPADHLMRFDVEVSGFPSSHCGHLCLLRLHEDDYPGTDHIDQWPTWDLPILQWAKQQGAVVGFAHSGWGLQARETQLPNYELPKFDGIGANEFIVDVTHDAVDFISAVDTPAPWELNVWYHTLNCGYTTRISGETDFPCIYGERVGLGRSYVKLPKDQPLDYDHWAAGIRDGRSYVCDGTSHLIDFSVNGLGVGETAAANQQAAKVDASNGRTSLLKIASGQELTIKTTAAALLPEKPQPAIGKRPLDQKPYWHVERARIGETNRVPVELIVNGKSVERKEIVADGKPQPLEFRFKPKRSSWLALRIYPSAHTNPIFVQVDDKPIRASRKSAQWCLDSVDVCWQSKVKGIRPAEQPAAAAAYEVARQAYRKILAESADD